MKCNLSKEQLIDFLFKELDDNQQAEISRHLEHCEACRAELAELQGTINSIQRWPDVKPASNLVFVPVNNSNKSRSLLSLQHSWRRWVAYGAVAAAFLVILFFRTDVRFERGRFALTIGGQNQVNSELNPTAAPVLLTAFKRMQEQNLLYMQQLVAESEKRQKELLLAGLHDLSQQIEQQRLSDLMYVGENLQAIQKANLYNFDRTNSILADLTRAVAVGLPNQIEKK